MGWVIRFFSLIEAHRLDIDTSGVSYFTDCSGHIFVHLMDGVILRYMMALNNVMLSTIQCIGTGDSL